MVPYNPHTLWLCQQSNYPYRFWYYDLCFHSKMETWNGSSTLQHKEHQLHNIKCTTHLEGRHGRVVVGEIHGGPQAAGSLLLLLLAASFF